MDDQNLLTLAVTAALIGIVHTATGPDHYIPFVAMARSRHWSLARTIVITLACGMGHVVGSVAIGVIGISAGMAVGSLKMFEGLRGWLAGWMLIGFGLAYLVWGVRRAIRNQPHTHFHVHADGVMHSHSHGHDGDHLHVHVEDRQSKSSITPWVLFTIFVFGPCEPLIPLLMFPAAKLSYWDVVLVGLVFAVFTLVTMTVVVTIGYLGLSRLSAGWLAKYSHAVAGFAIAACGVAVQFGL